jgi:hypothetical protein
VNGEARDLDVASGTTLLITGRATDVDGDLSDHWLELQNPAGSWSWEGWLSEDAWVGGLNGNGLASTKSTSYTFDQPGTYLVRTTAIDGHGTWEISAAVAIHVH